MFTLEVLMWVLRWWPMWFSNMFQVVNKCGFGDKFLDARENKKHASKTWKKSQTLHKGWRCRPNVLNDGYKIQGKWRYEWEIEVSYTQYVEIQGISHYLSHVLLQSHDYATWW